MTRPARKILRAVTLIWAFFIASLSAQTWTPLTNQPRFAASDAHLLTDGRVIVQDAGARDFWALTPDAYGSYRNGTWSQLASLPAGYSPLYYASAILPDGRMVMLGGEYNFFREYWTNLGAIYNPKTNAWKKLKAPSGWTTVGDAQSVVLPNGTFMVANCCTTGEALLDPVSLQWTATGSGKADINNEEGWTLLPSGQVLTVDVNYGNMHSELYDPKSGAWSSAGSTVAQLVDMGASELGPAVLRPDGTVLATGATGHNAIFNSTTSTWSAAPDFPKVFGRQLDIADGPVALLPNGNVLCMTSPGLYNLGVHFFEWDGATFTEVPRTPNAPYESSFFGRMLVLPTGEIMLTDGSSDVELYTSTGNPNPAWAPTIIQFSKKLIHGKISLLTGTQLNGLSQGAAYGDDAQSASNYPLIRITNNATGHVTYTRTHTFSSMGVATGAQIVTTNFDIPSTIDLGPSQLVVVANGIPSTPVSVTIN
jgi:hypothetical protein